MTFSIISIEHTIVDLKKSHVPPKDIYLFLPKARDVKQFEKRTVGSSIHRDVSECEY